jgi:hypothetical protein
LLSDDHPHGSETAQDPVEPPVVVVVVVVVIVIVGPVGRHQGAAVGHLNSVHFQYIQVSGPDLYGLAAMHFVSKFLDLCSNDTGDKLFTGVKSTGDIKINKNK